ncbi:hypothetical protein F5882DRAFT_427384 [Hyaloscypha sp. PMI_1271]|nr:hypothetical protein F5882DRAFT_427384 [Hyaloscypha sp. PMI_1271]
MVIIRLPFLWLSKSINSTLLAEDVQGRIDITRTFDGRELNTEYLFGLFANLAADPHSISLLGVPISYEILYFAANEYVTSAATRFMFNFTSLGLIIPIEINSYSNSAPLLNASSATQVVEILTRTLASSICETATTYCNVRFGEAYELGRNTLLCRMVHQNMVLFRLSVHYPHIGPSGGGYCTDDRTYVGTMEENYFNISFLPYGYLKH